MSKQRANGFTLIWADEHGYAAIPPEDLTTALMKVSDGRYALRTAYLRDRTMRAMQTNAPPPGVALHERKVAKLKQQLEKLRAEGRDTWLASKIDERLVVVVIHANDEHLSFPLPKPDDLDAVIMGLASVATGS